MKKIIFIEDFATVSIEELFARIDTWMGEKNGRMLRMRFGVGYEPMIFRAIAETENCTRQRVQQVEVKALKGLAEQARDVFEEYLEKRKSVIFEMFERGLQYFRRDDSYNIFDTLPVKDKIAIKVLHKRLDSFFSPYYKSVKGCWVLKDADTTVSNMVLNTSLEGVRIERMVKAALLKDVYPASFAKICNELPQVKPEAIRKTLVESFSAKILNDAVSVPPEHYNRRAKILISSRMMSRPMHVKEIQDICLKTFKTYVAVQSLRALLSSDKDMYLFERGVFAHRSVFPFTDEEIAKIEAASKDILSVYGSDMSAKNLLIDVVGKLPEFNGRLSAYSLLGIIGKNKEFKSEKGLMVGLATWAPCKSIIQEVREVFQREKRELSVKEIRALLSRHRTLGDEALQTTLKNNTDIVQKVGHGVYKLVSE